MFNNIDLFSLFPIQTRSSGDKDGLSHHAERRRGGEAADRGPGEGDEGPHDQRHLHACSSARQTAGRDSGGLALQVAVQEEKEIQASHVPEKEQEAEGESRDLSGRLCASDLDAVQYFGAAQGADGVRPTRATSHLLHRHRVLCCTTAIH